MKDVAKEIDKLLIEMPSHIKQRKTALLLMYASDKIKELEVELGEANRLLEFFNDINKVK